MNALFVLLLSLPAQPNGPVNDYANALTPVQLSQLDAQLRGWEKGSSQQIAVAIFPSLDGESLEDVSFRLATSWKIGGKGNNDGVLLTLFLNDHKLRIEVGYGLEGKLTDADSARIIRDVMVPKLKQNDVYDAIYNGVTAIHQRIVGERMTIASSPSHFDWLGILPFIGVLLVFGIIFWIAKNAARSGNGWSSSGSSWSSSSDSSWSSSDSSSSSSSSDSGWSGGGGDFGGGGASGSW